MCRRGRNRVREQRSHQLSGHGDRQHARLAWVYGKHVAECASVQQDRIVQKKKVAHGGERACEGHRLDACLFQRLLQAPRVPAPGEATFTAHTTDQGALGLRKGDRVALMMPNILQYPVALFGILRAGLIVVSVNPLYTARELEHQLKDSGPAALVIFEGAAATLQSILPATPVPHVLVPSVGPRTRFPTASAPSFIVSMPRISTRTEP